jgi:hypothetical protein
MRSIEFIKEAGGDRPAMTDAEYAAQQAQGQKNLDSLKGLGSKIAGAFKGNNQAATPAPTQPGLLRDRDGNPVRDGSGQPILTPGSPVPAAPSPAASAVAAPQTSMDDSDDVYASAFVPPTPSFRTPGAAQAGQGGTDTTASFRVPGAAQAGQGGTKPVQSATPKKSAFSISPAILGYASAMGLYKNGQPNADAIKAFQRKNGLAADGIIGPDTSGAILSAAPAGMAGSGRGGQGGAAAYEKISPLDRPTQGATPVPTTAPATAPTAPPPKPILGQRMPNGRPASQSDVLSWENQYGPGVQAAKAKSAADAAAAKTSYNPYAQNKVNEDISRMRLLAGLNKD